MLLLYYYYCFFSLAYWQIVILRANMMGNNDFSLMFSKKSIVRINIFCLHNIHIKHVVYYTSCLYYYYCVCVSNTFKFECRRLTITSKITFWPINSQHLARMGDVKVYAICSIWLHMRYDDIASYTCVCRRNSWAVCVWLNCRRENRPWWLFTILNQHNYIMLFLLGVVVRCFNKCRSSIVSYKDHILGYYT